MHSRVLLLQFLECFFYLLYRPIPFPSSLDRRKREAGSSPAARGLPSRATCKDVFIHSIGQQNTSGGEGGDEKCPSDRLKFSCLQDKPSPSMFIHSLTKCFFKQIEYDELNILKPLQNSPKVSANMVSPSPPQNHVPRACPNLSLGCLVVPVSSHAVKGRCQF